MSLAEFTNQENSLVYGPASLQQVLHNSITSPLFNTAFIVRGIYRYGKGTNYNGYYYDILKDESQDSNITLIVPSLIRNGLAEPQVISGLVVLSRRLNAATGRIDLLLTLNQVFSKEEKQISEDELARVEVLHRKSMLGYKDVDGLIRNKVYRKELVRIVIITGVGAIVDQDIRRQLKDAESRFDIFLTRVSLTNTAQISDVLRQVSNTDVVVLARGGGESLSIFDDIRLANATIDLAFPFITAIGHAVDEPLLQKMADKHFITPTAFGQYLHDLVSSTEEELTQSRVKLLQDLTKQVELDFRSRIVDLEKRLVSAEKREKEEREGGEKKLKQVNKDLEQSRTNNTIKGVILFILVVLLVYRMIIGK